MMKKNYSPFYLRTAFAVLLLLTFVRGWGQSSISTLGTAVVENFSGYVGTTPTIPTNWSLSSSTLQQGTNQVSGTAGGWYGNNNMSFLGSGSASNGNATWRLQNNTGSTITSLALSFTARMWRSQANSPIVSVTYSTNSTGVVPATGNLTSVLTFNDATSGIVAGTTLSQNINSLSIPNGDYIYIRFLHAGGSTSDNLGWDDVSITATATPAANPVLSINGTTNHGSVCVNSSATAQTYTIKNTGAAATGITVVSSDSQFVVSALSSNSITTGGTATYNVTFTPSSAGTKNATITVASTTSGSNSPTSSLTGTGSAVALGAVTTNSVGAGTITAKSAVLNGTVTSVGSCPQISTRGFIISETATNATPTDGGTGVTTINVGGNTATAFTNTPNNLLPSTQYSYRSYVLNGSTYTYGAVVNFTTLPALGVTGTADHGSSCATVSAAPLTYTITNNSIATVTGITVTSNNTEFAVGGSPATSLAPGATTTYTVTFTPSSSGIMSASITVASSQPNVSNTVTGTGAAGVLGAVTTNTAGSITARSAVLNGTVNSVGSCPAISERGFVYSENSINANPTVGEFGVTAVSVGSVIGAFTNTPNNLLASKVYTYRAYVLNGSTYTYGTPVSFSTQSALAVSNSPIHNSTCPTVSSTPVTYTITNNSAYTATGINVSSDNIEFVVSGNFATTLAPNATTTYTVTFTPATPGNKTAVITVSSNSADVLNFISGMGTTPVAQAVTTSAATGPTGTAATLNGNVTAVGVCPTSIEKGFVYSATATNADPIFAGVGVTKIAVGTMNSGAYNSTVNTLTAGTGYSYKSYIFNGTAYSYGAVQTFTTTTPPVNDNCPGSALIVGAAPITGNVAGATLSTTYSNYGSYSNARASDDVWYSFTTSGSGAYSVKVAGSASFDAVLEIRDNCGQNAFLAGIDETLSGEVEELIYAAAANTTYYVRVYDYDTSLPATTTFTIQVVPPPAVLSANGIASLNFGTVTKNNVSATQSFNASALFLSANQVATVTAPINYEVALTDTPLSFGSSVSLTAGSNGVIASTPIYVRFNSAAACGLVTGNVVLSATGATSVNVAVSATAAVTAPLATAATAITPTSFTANWNAVSGATAYELEVSKSPTFATSSSGTLTEGFESGTFPPTGWLNTSWTRSTTAADINTGGGAAIAGSNAGLLTTLAIANPSSVSFYLGRSTNNTAKTLTIEVSTTSQTSGFTTIATFDHANVPSASYNQYSVDLSAYNANPVVYIRFNKTSATASPWRLDDIAISYASSTPDFVTGYAPKIISGGSTTSSSVTGLEQNTQYYYRVRATDAACKSSNSNVILVTSLYDTTTYNGTPTNSWDHGEPVASVNAVINGDLNVAGNLTSKTLKVNIGKTLTISPNASFTTGDFINNGKLIVESDANFVQTEGSVNGGTGDATVKRIANIKRQDYVYWSSPVAGQKLKAFSPGTLNIRFLRYDEPTNKFIPVFSATDPTTDTRVFEKGSGYAIRASNSQSSTAEDWEGNFTGIPHNGNVDVNITATDSEKGYNMIGNPYPSNINLSGPTGLFTLNNGKTTETAYFWTNVNNNINPPAGQTYDQANYAVYSLSGSLPAANSTVEPTGVVKVGQSFIVKALSSGTLNITNTMRDANASSIFFDKNVSETNDRYWLRLTTPTNDFNTTLIAYIPNATNDFEHGYDATVLGQSSDALFTKLNSQKLAIQGRQFPLDIKDRVSLGSNHFASGQYRFSVSKAEGIFAGGQHIYLKDKHTNTITDLTLGDYLFTATAGTTENRFELVYENETVLATDNDIRKNLIIYRNGDEFILKSNADRITEVELYDSVGRLLIKTKPNAAECRINVSHLANAVYVLKINQSGKISSRKIIK